MATRAATVTSRGKPLGEMHDERTHNRLCVRSRALRESDQEQVSGPRGSGRVQFFVVPFSVITTFAVALPSYVTTSRRVSVTASEPVYASVALIERITVPAVG